MAKIIKEIIIMLLVALASMLLFAVILYEYIPNRKVIPEVSQYSASEKIKELKADNIDQRNEQIIKTFKVTSSDLSNYKVTNDYVAGKSDPFDPTKQSPDASSSTKKPGNEDNLNSSTTENTDKENDTKNEDTDNQENKETTKKEDVVTTK